jgi:hypothetical protein
VSSYCPMRTLSPVTQAAREDQLRSVTLLLSLNASLL